MTSISYDAYKVLQQANAELNLGGLAVLLPQPMTEPLNTEGVSNACFTSAPAAGSIPEPIWHGGSGGPPPPPRLT